MSENNKQAYVRGAAILTATMAAVKLLSFIYKVPLQNILGDAGAGHFQVTYQVYAVLLAVSTTGIPVALSRLVAAALSRNSKQQAARYFSVALPAFSLVGIVLSLLMFIFADTLAMWVRDPQAVFGIRVMSPAVFLVCIVSVYEGHAQGRGDMLPTAAKQITEVLSKLIIGMAVAWWLLRRGYGAPVISAGAIAGVPLGLLLSLFIVIIHKGRAEKTEYAHLSDAPETPPLGKRKTLAEVFKVSVPIAFGASFMSILTLVDTAVVRSRLHVGAGFSLEQVDILYGVYAKGLTLVVLPSAFIVPLTISFIPVIAAALSNRRTADAHRFTRTALKLTNIIAMPASLGLTVLSYPIFKVLFWNSNENGPAILSIFGIASYFICLQLMTTAILQANGHENRAVRAYLVGGAAQIIVDFILVSNPDIGIIGSPVGTLTCYILITLVNFMMIRRKVGFRPDIWIFLKPAAVSAVTAASAWAAYELLYKASVGAFGAGRLALALYLSGAILAAIVIYVILSVVTKTVTRADMTLLPKGEKLADFLRIR